MGNPRYNNARGAANLIGMPPFVFEGVVMRIFPLKASMRALRSFCDQYLNIVPPEFAVFEPAAPYVLLSAINYGRMSPESSSLGWVSQNEVVFSVMLKRSKLEGDQLVFEDWASVSPFIYVDDESSLATGREVYGWPKTLAWLTPGINEWARHPDASQDVFVLSSMVFPELFAGQRQEPRVLMDIQREPVPSISRLPLDLANPLNPLLSFPKAMIEGMSMVGEMVQAVAGLPIQGYSPNRDLGEIPQMMEKASEYLDIFRRLPVGNTVNLKQFRDARDANAACYQGITSGPMMVTRFNGGGLLGDMTQMRGDASGGYSVRIHRYPTQPIIESLGLEVDREEDAGDHSVASLKAKFPFWASLDFTYGQGELVCWRTTQIGWRKGTLPDENPEPPSTRAAKYPFNSARGAATEAVTGPFRFPNVTQRVLPLLATQAKLDQLCREYLDNDFSFFRSWGPYVYMIVTTFEEMSSETYNVGWWANKQVTFSFPVRWYKRNEVRQGSRTEATEQGELIGTAMFTPFAYTDSDVGASTGREVQGLPMVKASIESPRSSWLEDSGPARRSDLLRLSTNVYAAFNAGQESKEQVLFEITPREIIPAHDKRAWRRVAMEWGERLYGEILDRFEARTGTPDAYDNLRALAMELIRGDGQPINEISLRQFRDIEQPLDACYQGLTLTRTTIDELFEMAEIEEPLHLALHRYPSQPIVDILGLRVKSTDASGSSVVDYVEPVRPFWMKMAMRVDLGEDVFWRAASETWRPNTPDWFKSRADLEKQPAWSDQANPSDFYLVKGHSEVSSDLVREIDLDPEMKVSLKNAWRFWRYPHGDEPTCLSRSEARDAVGEDPEAVGLPPQFAIESLLENSWGRLGRPGEPRDQAPAFFLPRSFIGNDEVRAEYSAQLEFQESGDRLVHPGLEKQHATKTKARRARQSAKKA